MLELLGTVGPGTVGEESVRQTLRRNLEADISLLSCSIEESLSLCWGIIICGVKSSASE